MYPASIGLATLAIISATMYGLISFTLSKPKPTRYPTPSPGASTDKKSPSGLTKRRMEMETTKDTLSLNQRPSSTPSPSIAVVLPLFQSSPATNLNKPISDTTGNQATPSRSDTPMESSTSATISGSTPTMMTKILHHPSSVPADVPFYEQLISSPGPTTTSGSITIGTIEG